MHEVCCACSMTTRTSTRCLFFTVPSFTKSRRKEMISGWIDSNISSNLNNPGIDHLSPLSCSRIREETGLCKHRSSPAGTLRHLIPPVLFSSSTVTWLSGPCIYPTSSRAGSVVEKGRGKVCRHERSGVYMLPFWWLRAKYWTYSREVKSSIDPVII